MESATPQVAEMILRLMEQSKELQDKLDKLAKRYHLTDVDEPILLSQAKHNIVDRAAEKKRHLKSWKVEIKDTINTGVEYESLDSV